MKKNLMLIAVAIAISFPTRMYSQFFDRISIEGLFGVSLPQGTTFKTDDGEKMSSFGLNVNADIMYHFEELNYKLAVGLGWNGSFFFSSNVDGFVDIGIYGLNIFGAKGYYRFFDYNISPYASLTVGAAEFSLPEMTISVGDEYYSSPKVNSWNLGLRPEIGLDLGGLIISAAYIVPMKYKLDDVKQSAGGFQFSVGYRFTFFDW